LAASASANCRQKQVVHCGLQRDSRAWPPAQELACPAADRWHLVVLAHLAGRRACPRISPADRRRSGGGELAWEDWHGGSSHRRRGGGSRLLPSSVVPAGRPSSSPASAMDHWQRCSSVGSRPLEPRQPELARQARGGRDAPASPRRTELAGRGAAARPPGARWPGTRLPGTAAGSHRGREGAAYGISSLSLENVSFLPSAAGAVSMCIDIRVDFVS
jgi:hypothetical protein